MIVVLEDLEQDGQEYLGSESSILEVTVEGSTVTEVTVVGVGPQGPPGDNVVSVEDFASLPEDGNIKNIYITTDDNFTYRWDEATSEYAVIGGSNEDQLSLIAVRSLADGLILIGGDSPPDPAGYPEETLWFPTVGDFLAAGNVIPDHVSISGRDSANSHPASAIDVSGSSLDQVLNDLALDDLADVDTTVGLVENDYLLYSDGAWYNAGENIRDKFNAKANLVGGTVPANELPSYVDDVLEFANFAALPGTGEAGKVYVTIDTNVTYRWGGSSYVAIGSDLALGETSSTAYRGDRGKEAYDIAKTALVFGEVGGPRVLIGGAEPPAPGTYPDGTRWFATMDEFLASGITLPDHAALAGRDAAGSHPASAIDLNGSPLTTVAPNLQAARSLLGLDRVVAWDSFNRTNSSDAGVADSGQMWSPLFAAGGIGVSDNAAYCPLGNTDVASVLDVGTGDVEMSAWIYKSGNFSIGFVFRAVDADNYLEVVWRNSGSNDQASIRKWENGVRTTIASLSVEDGAPAGVWTQIKVSLSADHVKAFLGGYSQHRLRLSAGDYALFPSTLTRHGLHLRGNLERIDDLVIGDLS